ERFARAGEMLPLDIVVVGADDGFLALEIVIGGPERQSGAPRDVADGRFLEAALAEERQRGLQNLAAGFFAADALRDRPRGRVFEHVQILWRPAPGLVKPFLNVFRNAQEVWPNSFRSSRPLMPVL